MAQHVFDNGMVAHVWAQQEQDEGRSHNGNFSFSGNKLYSYSTVIATIVQGGDGSDVVLITDATYSTTTSGKHMPALHRAVRGMSSYCVPSLGAREAVNHERNLAALVKRYEDHKASAMRRREFHEYELERLVRADTQVHDYALSFDLDIPELDLEADQAAIWAHHAARLAKFNTPAAIAKREREAAKREAKQAEAQRLLALSYAEKVTAWQAGADVRLGYSVRDEHSGAYLRVRGDSLETSLGATVPLDHAVKAFRFIKAMHDAGKTWERNGHTIHVGHFQVDRIEADGSIRAGCHYIHWTQIERTARELGLYEDGSANVVPLCA